MHGEKGDLEFGDDIISHKIDHSITMNSITRHINSWSQIQLILNRERVVERISQQTPTISTQNRKWLWRHYPQHPRLMLTQQIT